MASMRPTSLASPNIRASRAALASPAADNGGSGALTDSFSACRITITVVELAVNHTQIAQSAMSATINAANAPMALSQIGIRNGPR